MGQFLLVIPMGVINDLLGIDDALSDVDGGIEAPLRYAEAQHADPT